MALWGEIPRGLEDLKVAVLSSDTPGSNIDAPGARGFTVGVTSDSDQLEGDNAVIAVVRNPKVLSGDIEIGRLNLAALAAMVGGSATTSGSDPNQIITLNESASAAAQYFQAIGNTYSQDSSGSGYRLTGKKLLVVDGPNESMTVNEWSTPTLSFEGVGISGVLLTRANYQTFAAVS